MSGTRLFPLELTVFPLISIFAMITNSLSIAVFLQPVLKDQAFKYMLAGAVVDLIYSTILIYNFMQYCSDCYLLGKQKLIPLNQRNYGMLLNEKRSWHQKSLKISN